MKKAHLTLLIITFILTLFSAYSLAAINQTYTIDFNWYSQYNNKFVDSTRNTASDRWDLATYPKGMHFFAFGKESLQNTGIIKLNLLKETEDYIYLYASLGKSNSPEYKIKFTNIAQRGSVVEIKLSLNSPLKAEDKNFIPKVYYYPNDIIRIDKNSFPVRGKLYFIFKNQYGQHLFDKYYYI